MADKVLFLGWSRPRAGKDAAAMQLFDDSLKVYAAAQAAGEIESFEPILMMYHGGDLNGCIIIRGTAEKLDAFRRSEKFLDIAVRCSAFLDGFGVTEGWINEGLQKMMGMWAKATLQ